MKINFTLNGVPKDFYIKANETALVLLRKQGIFSVKDGCSGEGTCGSCAILLDGQLINSCILLAAQLEGKDVRTSETLAKGPNINNIQQAFLEVGIVQCGYCTPAMLLASVQLLDAHREPTKDQINDYFSGIICRCTGYEQIYDAFKLIINRSKDDPNFIFKHVEFCDDLRHVGKIRKKVDGVKLLKSDPSFVEDFMRPNTLHLKVLRSPHAHAIIKKIDVSKAEALPGVVFIATHENVPDVLYSSAGQGSPEPSPHDRKVIDVKVRFVGDRVAAVAAETEEIAKVALKLINVEYEILEPVLSLKEAMEGKGGQIHHKDKIHYCFPIGGDVDKNIAASNVDGIGDLKAGFEEADHIVERTYHTGHIQCTPLEPHVVHTYMDGERLVISASTQVPFHLRRIVSSIIGIPEEMIHVIKQRVGGGFGAKQDIVMEELAAFVTFKTGRPVFFRFTREEEFVSSRTRHPTTITVKIGATKEGKITAVNMISRADTGPYGVHCLTVPMNAASKSLPLLRCKTMHFDIVVYYTNNVIAGAYQGYGAPAGSNALQMSIAELADEMNIDYLELIRKNHVYAGDTLDILKILGEGQEGIPQKVTSCGIKDCLDIGSESIKWGEIEKTDKPYLKRGKGFAIIQQGSGLPGIDQANASVLMLGNGGFKLLTGGADLGTGLDTVCAKVAAEVLQCEHENISVTSGDTDSTPFDVGAYASSGTFFSGTASMKAALDMKEKILIAASEIMEMPVEKLKIEYPSTVVSEDGKKITYGEIAHTTQAGTGKGQLIGLGAFTTEEAPIPYGAHFCEVEVDERTGKIKVLAYHAYQDCGTPINPELARGQMFGAVMKSIGHSLYEELVFDDKGKCINGNFTDYKIPTILDLPEDFRCETVLVEEHLGPFGGKSISEIATNATAPAIATAVHEACGIWMRHWPFTSEKVLRELKKRDENK